MAYLPKHYVKTGLVANQGEFITKVAGLPYTGPYYEIGTGQIFSGLGPEDISSQELVKFGNLENPPGTTFQEVSVAFNLDVLNLRPGESSNFIQNSPDVNFQIYQAQMVDEYTKLKKFTEKDYSGRKLPYGIRSRRGTPRTGRGRRRPCASRRRCPRRSTMASGSSSSFRAT